MGGCLGGRRVRGQLRIEQLYAFVVVDDDGTEGIPAIPSPDGPLPLVGADMERVDSLRGVAVMLATHLGKPITLCQFSERTEVDVIYPEEPR
jgi:hypothetical protein